MKKMKYAALTLFTALASLPASAQIRDVNVFANAWKTILKSLQDDVTDIVLLTVGLIAAVLTIIAFIQHNSGDREGAKTWFKLAGGLVMVLIIVQLVKVMMG